MNVVSSTVAETSFFVEVCNVSKWFGSLMALNGISLKIGPGITGLVGPNGAGKTTLLNYSQGKVSHPLAKFEFVVMRLGWLGPRLMLGFARMAMRHGMSCPVVS